ncbi:l-carnitine dehydratase bile acid-inducible protein f [Moniliophthora roreri MCA 2997]|uniref:L-carnitine dehydratase bile acid-inducible protein f n=1 Tax=Moniliophthora roreri (strain MCA 2997) TaxID=1381753 RepID=V2XPA5_MONRO|nr:l-carnitine dehydratase bile acid-inducible protein f [Moniliophthora roreri MCA 2997]
MFKIVRPFVSSSRRGVRSSRALISTSTKTPTDDELPLSGIRVLEMGQLIAGPFAGQLLGQYGAEVIKVEPPKTGDPLRVWRELDLDGTSPWFRSIARNKKSVAIDLRKAEGRELVKRLAIKSDVLIENFKPGTLEKWSLGPESLHPYNPSLIFTRVSGYGQTGPWSPRPGYASVCEAESGFRYVNGFPDPATGGLSGLPVRPNLSLGDSVAGLHAAFGTVIALLSRQRKRKHSQEGGSVVDVSILESMLNLMEGVVPEYDRKGTIRGPAGSALTGVVPTNSYPCLPDPEHPSLPSYIVIGANGDTLYNKLMNVVERPDLTGPSFQQNHHRVAKQAEIDGAISDWTRKRSTKEVMDILTAAGIPVGRVVSVKDIVEGEQIQARGAVQEVWVQGNEETKLDGWNVKMTGTFPVLEGVDSKPKWAGPDLGYHTDEVLKGDLGLTDLEINNLRKDGIIG